MTVDGMTAVVTGGSEGIGRAIVIALARAGARVACCARQVTPLDALAADLAAEGRVVRGFPCDVTDAAQVAAFAEAVRRAFGDPMILVNNAGIGRFGPLDELAMEDVDAVLATNVRSLFLVTRAFLPAMKRAGRGDIVNVVSLSARGGLAGNTLYGASKHAALGFSRSLLFEVRPHGVRVIAICPGSVDTPFFAKADAPRPDPARILAPDDVAATVLATLTLPRRATVSELDLRPANP